MTHVTVVGRVTDNIKSEKFCYQQQSQCAVNFSIVDNVTTKNKPVYVKCCAYNKQAEILHKYVKKGDNLAIAGHLGNNIYKKKDGTTCQETVVHVQTIHLLSTKPQNIVASSSTDTKPQDVVAPSPYENRQDLLEKATKAALAALGMEQEDAPPPPTTPPSNSDYIEC